MSWIMELCGASVSALTLQKMSTNAEDLAGMKLVSCVILLCASMHAQFGNVSPRHILGDGSGEWIIDLVWYRRPDKLNLIVGHSSRFVTQ